MKKRFLFLALALCMIFTLGLALAEKVEFPPATETETPTTCEHDWVVVPAKAATCTEDGTHGHKVCSECGAIDPENAVIAALGHAYEVTATTEATCTEGASTVETCSRCGDVQTKTGKALGHTWGDLVQGYPAKCEEDGANAYAVCEVCGAVQVGEAEYADLTAAQEAIILPAFGEHAPEKDWLLAKGTADKAPTCDEPGVKAARYCPKCYELMQEEETVSATGHKWKESAAYKAPDCENAGATAAFECEKGCGATKGGEPIAALGHVLATVDGKEPSCTEAGQAAYKYCTRANCNHAELVDDPKTTFVVTKNDGEVIAPDDDVKIYPLNHEKDGVSQLTAIDPVPATCTTPGLLAGGTYCTLCESVVTDAQVEPAKGHTEQTLEEAVEATCTETGLTAHVVCSVCGENLQAQETTPALGHTEKAVEAKEATCTDGGHTAGVECSVCGETLEGIETIPALGHTDKIIPGYPATCLEDGKTDGVECSVCGDTLTAQTDIPATGHTITQIIKAQEASCTVAGWTEGMYCGACNTWLVESEEIPAAGHSFNDLKNAAPTCTEEGYENYGECSVCGETTGKVLDAPGHTWSNIPDKAPTCTETGVTGARTCSVCNKLEMGTIDPALGHDWQELPEEPATCTKEGLTAGTVCGREGCDAVLEGRETISMQEHDWQTIEAVAPTCVADGNKEGQECSVCHLKEGAETIKATGHASNSPWKEVIAPSYESEGMKVQICTTCNHAFNPQTIPMLKPDTYPGDADGNGYLDLFDVLVILQYTSGDIDADAINLELADYNEDGEVDIWDAYDLLYDLPF